MSETEKYGEGLTPTQNLYTHPFPSHVRIKAIEYGGPSHEGPYKGAIDFIVADGTPIIAPYKGAVVSFDDTHTRYGPSPEFEKDLNVITLRHPNGEFSQIGHLAKGTVTTLGIKVGDILEEGQLLGVSGRSGWMDKDHIHFYVFRVTGPQEFHGLAVQFRDTPKIG